MSLAVWPALTKEDIRLTFHDTLNRITTPS